MAQFRWPATLQISEALPLARETVLDERGAGIGPDETELLVADKAY